MVFGAGDYGHRYLAYAANPENSENAVVVGFLDNNIKKCVVTPSEYPCYLPDKIHEIEYDKIIIANVDPDQRSKMFTQLMDLNISREIVGFFPDKSQIENKIEKKTQNYRRRFEFFETYAQFVYGQGIRGNIVECGVHKGHTAEFLNLLYPDRKLYLFDTFEGFSEADVIFERGLGKEAFLNGPSNRPGGFRTSIDLVMDKMTNPENVVIHKGYVPETLNGVDDIFCFVHLDMDLYQPMLAATKFFWDKMSENGVIILHDYWNPKYQIGQVVEDFEANLNRKIPKLPIPPHVGIALIKC